MLTTYSRFAVGTLCLVLILISCSPATEQTQAPVLSEAERLQEIANRVTIIRDDFGVGHIYAPTDADAVFGLLYAQAEDDFARVERNYIWATGRLAEIEGEAALYSDLRAKLYMTEEEAHKAYADAPVWLQELCDAFADGLNFYLAKNPQVQPQLFDRFHPWMPFYFFEGSIGGDIEQIPLPRMEAFYSQIEAMQAKLPIAAQASEPAFPIIAPRDNDLARTIFEEPAGSNGIAVDGSLTESGNPMLLINPHTSFYFRGEYHVVSEEGLNAYGAVTWGQFFIYQGFNEHNGWMHTTTAADFMDEFVEDVVTVNGQLQYRYGDDLRPVQVSEISLQVNDNGQMSERLFPAFRTHHGPITHSIEDRWVVTRINWNPVDALRQSYLRMKTADYSEFRAMMDIRTNSSNNTVYADNSGNIAYFHGNFMPRRDPLFDYLQPVDGSNPATDWQGVHPVDETIFIHNPTSGYIQNSNSTPFTAAGAQSPKVEDYPAYMAPDAENFRAVHSIPLLENAQALTLDSFLDIAYDNYMPGFAQLIPGLVSAWDANSDNWRHIEAPIQILREWDMRTDTESVGMSLAHFYGVMAAQNIDTPNEMTQMEQVNWLGTGSAPEDRLQVFSDTVAQLNASFGNWDTPWGEINRFQRLSGDITLQYDDTAPSLAVGMGSGRWGALASYGARAFPGTNRIYGSSGNSFVAVVEFGDRVKAKSILAGGQSSSVNSVHFDDQAQRYVDREFKEVAYYREDVDRRASSSYHPGE